MPVEGGFKTFRVEEAETTQWNKFREAMHLDSGSQAVLEGASQTPLST